MEISSPFPARDSRLGVTQNPTANRLKEKLQAIVQDDEEEIATEFQNNESIYKQTLGNIKRTMMRSYKGSEILSKSGSLNGTLIGNASFENTIQNNHTVFLSGRQRQPIEVKSI